MDPCDCQVLFTAQGCTYLWNADTVVCMIPTNTALQVKSKNCCFHKLYMCVCKKMYCDAIVFSRTKISRICQCSQNSWIEKTEYMVAIIPITIIWILTKTVLPYFLILIMFFEVAYIFIHVDFQTYGPPLGADLGFLEGWANSRYWSLG